YDWIVFTSANGVEAFFARFAAARRDVRELASVRLAAIGPETAAQLERRLLRVAVTAEDYRAEGLLAALAGEEMRGRRVLLPRAPRARRPGRRGDRLSRPAAGRDGRGRPHGGARGGGRRRGHLHEQLHGQELRRAARPAGDGASPRQRAPRGRLHRSGDGRDGTRPRPARRRDAGRLHGRRAGGRPRPALREGRRVAEAW